MPFVSKTLQNAFCACIRNILKIVMFVIKKMKLVWERSGSVVECLTRDRRAAGSSLTGVTALCP